MIEGLIFRHFIILSSTHITILFPFSHSIIHSFYHSLPYSTLKISTGLVWAAL